MTFLARALQGAPSYEVGVAFNAVAASAPVLALNFPVQVAPLSLVVGVTKIVVNLTSATATTLRLIGAATNGTLPTAVQGVDTENPYVANSQARVQTAWGGVPPTAIAATNTLRFMAPTAAAGQIITWEWPEDSPLIVQTTTVAKSLLLMNVNAGGATATMNVSLRWKETRV